MSADRRDPQPLPAILEAAVTEFKDWCSAYRSGTDDLNTVTAPLYHYTNAEGLQGIIKNQNVWFTSFTHLNDPTELEYGMSIASELLSEIGKGSEGIIKMFCEIVNSKFTLQDISDVFGFFVASFSRDRDDLGQWRAYGDNGRGFSLGLAPHLFAVEDKDGWQPHETIFVMPVVYGKEGARQHHRPVIERAVQIVRETVDRAADLMRDRAVSLPFLLEMAPRLAVQMIPNSLSVKHEAYQHEREVRLFIPGEHRNLTTHVSTRSRGGDIVPFIKSPMPIQASGSIVEIVIGPAAADSAEDGVCSLLKPFHNAPDSIVHRSAIPYRAH